MSRGDQFAREVVCENKAVPHTAVPPISKTTPQIQPVRITVVVANHVRLNNGLDDGRKNYNEVSCFSNATQ